MSEITSIEFQKKDDTRANLYLDGEFFAGISVELVLSHHLKKGMEVDENNLREIILEDEKVKAMDKAIKYISSTLKTTRQIRDYLRKKEYCDDIINYVIDKLKEYKYLDDTAYAKAYLQTYSNKYGHLKLKAMLRGKGVSDKDIDKAFESVEIDTTNNLSKVAEKYLKNKEMSRETLNKLSRFLYSRGYDFDSINSYINNLK